MKEDATEILKNTDKNIDYQKNIKVERITAPVKYGDVVGELELLDENKNVVKTIPITIKENIAKRNYFDNFVKIIKEVLNGKTTHK